MRRFVILCVLAASVPVQAITVKPLSFSELVDTSAAVVHGRVTGVHGQWTADRRGIESLVSLDVLAYFKGDLGPRVTIRVPGGRAGGLVNLVPGAPAFSEGDHVVLFLKVNGPAIPVVTGTTQGVFRVATDSRSGSLLVVPPLVNESGPARIVRGDPARRPLPLDDFEAAVQRAREDR